MCMEGKRAVSRRYDCAEPDQRAAGLREAAATIRRGDLIVLPTDTVYGLGCDAFSSSVIFARIASTRRSTSGDTGAGRCARAGAAARAARQSAASQERGTFMKITFRAR